MHPVEPTEQFATQLFEAAAGFYRSPAVELPGYLSVSVGIFDVLGWRVTSRPVPLTFAKARVFSMTTSARRCGMPLDQFLASAALAAAPLFDELKFGFDL